MGGDQPDDEPAGDVIPFLKAVRADPDEDGPRLVLADWLEENGDPELAAVIRAGCEHARSDPSPWSQHMLQGGPVRTVRMPGTQLARFAARWLGGSPPSTLFHRGFPLIRCSGKALEDFIARVHPRGLPWLQVLLGGRWDQIAPWLVDSRGGRLAMLRVGPSILGPGGLAEVARSPELATLTSFKPQPRLLVAHDDGVTAFAMSPYVANLTTLDLSSLPLGSGVVALAASPHLAGLKTLRLCSRWIGPEETAALAGSLILAGLSSLDLGGCEIGDEGAATLAASPHLSRLTTLCLRHNKIGPAGAVALTGGRFDRLSDLNLASNRLRDEGALALAGAANARTLVSLDLQDNKVRDAGVLALLQSPHLAGLKHLRLTSKGLTAKVKAAVRDRFGASALE